MSGEDDIGRPMVSFPVEPTVSYTVKEILERIERHQGTALDRLERKFDDVIADALNRLTDHDQRLLAIEHEKTTRRALRENWIALIALAAAITAGIGALFGAFHG